jgi:hypothetical protein
MVAEEGREVMARIYDDPPKSGTKGIITTTRTVWCADCTDWLQATENAGAKRAESEWMGHGWVWTKKLGWVCPECYNARIAKAYPSLNHPAIGSEVDRQTED